MQYTIAEFVSVILSTTPSYTSMTAAPPSIWLYLKPCHTINNRPKDIFLVILPSVGKEIALIKLIQCTCKYLRIPVSRAVGAQVCNYREDRGRSRLLFLKMVKFPFFKENREAVYCIFVMLT